LEDSRDGYGKTVLGQVGWDGIIMEFPKSIPNSFQNCREIRILMEGEVGDIPGSVKDSTKDFRLEGLDACYIGRLG
jgi:hypothetical protein